MRGCCSLKSGNVLLDKKYRAKLADVGLAKTLTTCHGCEGLATYMSTGELGTFAWAAPEVQPPHIMPDLPRSSRTVRCRQDCLPGGLRGFCKLSRPFMAPAQAWWHHAVIAG